MIQFKNLGAPRNSEDVPTTVRSLLRDLIPEIPEHRMGLDRAHRALQPPPKDGLPRDIIIKPHFYAVKEGVMKASRTSDKLLLQGHQVQIFADLSPYTVQKRRALKPLLQALMQKRNHVQMGLPSAPEFLLPE